MSTTKKVGSTLIPAAPLPSNVLRLPGAAAEPVVQQRRHGRLPKHVPTILRTSASAKVIDLRMCRLDRAGMRYPTETKEELEHRMKRALHYGVLDVVELFKEELARRERCPWFKVLSSEEFEALRAMQMQSAIHQPSQAGAA